MNIINSMKRSLTSFFLVGAPSLFVLVAVLTMMGLREDLGPVLDDVLAGEYDEFDDFEYDIPTRTNPMHPGRYIFGVTTGHSGSAAAQYFMTADGCPWSSSDAFEVRGKNEIMKNKKYPLYDSCQSVKEVLLPLFDGLRGDNDTWVDLGHYHNRGEVLECMADLEGSDITFVHIRRNRYSIARSFLHGQLEVETPCLNRGGASHAPVVSYCPHSSDNNPAFLDVDDDVWDGLTPFQKFLWWADEIEYRYYTLKERYSSPHYFEVTWATNSDFYSALNKIRYQLGCTSSNFNPDNPDMNSHSSHGKGTWNCTEMVIEDLEYRKIVNYTDEQRFIVFDRIPQRIDMEECGESRHDLEAVVTSSSSSARGWIFL